MRSSGSRYKVLILVCFIINLDHVFEMIRKKMESGVKVFLLTLFISKKQVR